MVPRKRSDEGSALTTRELDVISILWRKGSGTVAEVREALGEEDTGYTTILKILQILEEKGYVRFEKEGRAHRYFPILQASEAGGTALARILSKVFGGSADLLLAELISDKQIPSEQLERMRRILEEAEDEAEETEGS